MTKVKTKCCTKEDAAKDIKKRLWEDEFIITLHIWEDNKIWIELDSKWDEGKATDYFVDRFRYGCISSLLYIWQELLWDDIKVSAQIVKDFLDQLRYWAKDEFGISEKDEAVNRFRALFEKSVKTKWWLDSDD